jgi:uncharacterized membrane protein
MSRTNTYWAIALVIVAASWVGSAVMYPLLPETVPTHWNFQGQVDGYGSRATATLLLPSFMIGMLGLFVAIPYLSPKNFEVDTFRSTYLFLMVVTMGMFAYLHGVILLATWQQASKAAHPIDIGRTMLAGMFLCFALIGNVMGKVRRNFFVGVRTPWTLASERVWNDTHRLASWSMVAGSLLGFLFTVAGISLILAFALLIGSCLFPVVYSFFHYKALERRGAL